MEEINNIKDYGCVDNFEQAAKTDANKIKALLKEIELYKQAIQDAKDALASAEQELDETLDIEYYGR